MAFAGVPIAKQYEVGSIIPIKNKEHPSVPDINRAYTHAVDGELIRDAAAIAGKVSASVLRKDFRAQRLLIRDSCKSEALLWPGQKSLPHPPYTSGVSFLRQ